MKILVDVKRAEQSYEMDAGTQQNYLVIEIFGIETRVPCSDAKLVEAIREMKARSPGPAMMLESPSSDPPVTKAYVDQESRREAQPLFVSMDSPDLDISDLSPSPVATPRKPMLISRAPRITAPPPPPPPVAPVVERLTDDSGIAQG